MKVLKIIAARNEVQKILYTNIRIRDTDNLEVKRQKRAIQTSVSRYVRSKRRCVEMLIQNNFTAEDWYCVLTFQEDKLPPEKVQADAKFQYFLKRLKQAGCSGLRYLKVLEHRHGAGRYHFHVVLAGQGVTQDKLRQAWAGAYGFARVAHLRIASVPRLAGYLCKEAPDAVNKRLYSRSRPPNALQDPTVQRMFVPDHYRLVTPRGCQTVERRPLCENAFGTVESLSYLTPDGRANMFLTI